MKIDPSGARRWMLRTDTPERRRVARSGDMFPRGKQSGPTEADVKELRAKDRAVCHAPVVRLQAVLLQYQAASSDCWRRHRPA